MGAPRRPTSPPTARPGPGGAEPARWAPAGRFGPASAHRRDGRGRQCVPADSAFSPAGARGEACHGPTLGRPRMRATACPARAPAPPCPAAHGGSQAGVCSSPRRRCTKASHPARSRVASITQASSRMGCGSSTPARPCACWCPRRRGRCRPLKVPATPCRSFMAAACCATWHRRGDAMVQGPEKPDAVAGIVPATVPFAPREKGRRSWARKLVSQLLP